MKNRAPLKSAEVRDLAAFLERSYSAEIVLKKNSARMKIVKAFLDLCGIRAAEHFIKDYATTLVPPLLVLRPTVYLPFTPGSTGKNSPSLLDQAMMICHEFHHVRQWRKRRARWAIDYAKSKAKRAEIEAEALEVNCEICYQISGELPNVGTLAANLAAYSLRKKDLLVVARHLRSKAKTIEAGGVRKTITKNVVNWLSIRRGHGVQI